MAFIDEGAAAKLAGPVVRPAVLLLVKCHDGDWLRAWSGFGDFPVAADGIDTTGGVYDGLGELVDAPAVNQLINGLAERLAVTLSGVDTRVLQLAEEDAPNVRGAAAHVGTTFLGADLQPIIAPLWLWEGVADNIGVSRSDGLRAVSLSIASPDAARTRPQLSYFTGAHQRRRSSDDAFCDRTVLYAPGSTVRWPT